MNTALSLSRGQRLALLSQWVCILSGCAVCLVWWAGHPLLGDDLLYACDYEARGSRLTALPGQAAAVWTGCNARTGDMLNTLWLAAVPRPAAAIISCVLLAVMAWSVLRLSGMDSRRPLASAAAAGALVWCLPWRDMTHFVCFFNYPWGMAMGGIILVILLSDRRLSPWWLAALPVVFIGAATHEALAVPLGAGAAAWLAAGHGKRRPGTVRLCWLAAIFAAAAFSLSSPASYARLGAAQAPDMPLVPLLLRTVPLVLVLVSLTLLMLLFRRPLLRRLSRGAWLLFAVAAVVSALFVAVGGTAGRAGWFAECFALMALGRFWCALTPDISSPSVWKICGAVAIYAVATAYIAAAGAGALRRDAILKHAVDIYPAEPARAVRILQEAGADDWDIASLPAIVSRRRP